MNIKYINRGTPALARGSPIYMPLVYAQLCLSEMPVLTHISTGKHQCGESTNTVPAKVALPRKQRVWFTVRGHYFGDEDREED